MKKSILIIFLIIVLISSCVLLDISLFFGFFISIILILLTSSNKSILLKSSYKGIKQCKSLYLIILLLGANISIWMSSGLIPTVIYYGFDKISDVNFLFFAFISTALLSSAMGTGLGTLSTIGIAILGIGKGFGIPEHILLGSIISGAFISDKISPVSALTNLTIDIVGVDYKSYLRSCIKTLSVTVLVSGVVYYIIGMSLPTNIDGSLLDSYRNVLLSNYEISLFLFLIPIGIIIMALFNINVLVNMTTVLVTGSIITVLVQKIKLYQLIEFILYGYKSSTGDMFIDSILKAGGILPMIEVLLIVSAAIILNSMLMSSHILEPIFDKILRNTNTNFSLILKTGIISSLLTTFTCDQTVGIVVPGEIMQDKYKEMNISKEILARTISDTGTIIAPLEFWNVNSLIIVGVTGIATTQYAPYAILCFIAPIVTLIFAKLKK